MRRIAFGLVLLSAGLGPLAPTIEGKFVLHLLVQMFLVIAVMLWLLSMSLEGRIRLRRTGLGAWLLLFAGAIIASAWNAPYRYPPLLTGFLWFSNILAFLFVLNEARSRRARLLLLAVIAGSALVVSFQGIHQVVVDFPEMRSLYEADPEGVLRIAGLPEDMAFDFQGRLEKDRVFGTFLNPNSLAGFLTLVWPACLGLFLDGLRSSRQRGTTSFDVWRGVLLLPFLGALYFTRSKGGWMAFLLAMGVFGFWAFKEFLRRRRMHAVGVLVGVLIVLGVAQVSGLGVPVGDYLGSSSVRYGYWRSGLVTIEKHPLLGIGLKNFADAYAAEKHPEDQEARHAHNDYIQMAAEIGLIGLFFYVLFWVQFWLRVKRRETEATLPPRESPLPASDVVKIAVVLSVSIFLVEGYCSATLRSVRGFWGWVWPVALWLMWMGFVLMHTRRGDIPGPTRNSYATVGMACGLIGFLAHSFVDFDHYVAGIFQTAWLMMALLLASRLSEEGETYAVNRTIRPAWRLCLTVAAAGLTIFLMYGFVLPAAEAQIARENAMDATNDLSVEQRLAFLKRAVERNPWDAHNHALLSDAYLYMSLAGKSETPKGISTVSEAIKRAREATKINPMRSEYFVRLGRLYELRWLTEGASDDYSEALNAYSRAEALFPSIPDTALHLGRLHDLAGDRVARGGDLHEAKRLHGIAHGKYHDTQHLSEPDVQTHRFRRFNTEDRQELQDRIDVLRQWTTGPPESAPPPPLVFKSLRLRGLPRRPFAARSPAGQ